MKTQIIPNSDSIHELAQFWDSHDLTDFEDQLEEVTEPIFERKPDTVIRVHFQRQEFDLLRSVAKAQGTDFATLIRLWVLEKLQTKSPESFVQAKP
jgi:hypothetical protein